MREYLIDLNHHANTLVLTLLFLVYIRVVSWTSLEQLYHWNAERGRGQGQKRGTPNHVECGTIGLSLFGLLIQNEIRLFGMWNNFLDLLILLAPNTIEYMQDLVYGIKI